MNHAKRTQQIKQSLFDRYTTDKKEPRNSVHFGINIFIAPKYIGRIIFVGERGRLTSDIDFVLLDAVAH